MPKLIYLSVVFSLCLSVTALGQSGLRTANSVQVESGFIDESVVLADDASQLFLEFIKGDRVAKKLDGQIYEGEILPPLRIDAPAKAPRARMRELLSFEVISDNNEEIELIDQFTALHPKDRLRQGFKNQAGQRRLGAQLIALFEAEDAVSRPALWHYDEANLNPRWERLGGIMGETPAGESQIFSAFIYGTGRFTIWDENPQPDFQPSFPNDEIELAETSPFPSISNNSNDFISNTTAENLEKIFSEEQPIFELTEENIQERRNEFAETLAFLETPMPFLSVKDQQTIQTMIVLSKKGVEADGILLTAIRLEKKINVDKEKLRNLIIELNATPIIAPNIPLIQNKITQINTTIDNIIIDFNTLDQYLKSHRALTVEAANLILTLTGNVNAELSDSQQFILQNDFTADAITQNDLVTQEIQLFVDFQNTFNNEVETKLAQFNRTSINELSSANNIDSNGSQSPAPMVPAVPANTNDATQNQIPAVPVPGEGLITNSQFQGNIPIPSDLNASAPFVPSVTSPSNSLLSQYFQENLLVLSSAERNSLGNPTTEIVEAFEAKRVINTNAQASESIRADLLAQADLQILTAELAEIVIDSIDNQIALVNGLEATEEQALWVNIEQPNAAKVLNKIEEIETWQTNHALVFANLDLNSPAKLKIDLIPKLKAHYEAYFTLPVTAASALQTNAFQDFGVNEGDLPEAGGVRFPWLLIIVLGIFGFSVYTLRQKPY